MRGGAVILAAGSGQRMQGQVEDKILALVQGRPVLRYSLRAFADSGCVEQVIIVTRPEPAVQARVREAILGGDFPFRWQLVTGGGERQDSVRAGLEALDPELDLAFIHDGARPLIRGETICRLTEVAAERGSAVLARPVTDTIREADQPGQDVLTSSELRILDRQRLWAMETPQVFRRAQILDAYRRLQAAVTDDAAAWQLAGGELTLVRNPHPNPKITFPDDLKWVEFLTRPELPQRP